MNTTHDNFIEEKMKEFDEKSSTDIDSGGFNVPYEGLYDEYVKSFIRTALQDQQEKILDFIDKNYLQYCREQNGMDSCKNCGLNIEELRGYMAK